METPCVQQGLAPSVTKARLTCLSTFIQTMISCVMLAQPIAAHPISLSSVVVDVCEDHVKADIQIMLEDLVLYHALQADGNYVYSAVDLRAAAEKHQKFVIDYFSVLDADGNRLVAKLDELETDKIDEQGVPQTELMKKSVNYVLSFPVERRQAFFTFTQTFGGPNAVLPALMDLMVLQNGVLLGRPTQLTQGRPHTAKFDWEHPPTNAPTSFREMRRQRDEQLREQLGIASYGGLYSFLYVTRFEVRHEILIPLLTLEQWIPLPRKDAAFLEVDEQQAARDKIERFFQDRNPVSVNGEKIAAKLTRLNFFALDINDFALNAEPRRVSVQQARVGVILTYPSRATPVTVAMQWTTFSEHAPYLRSIVLVGNEAPVEHYFRPNRPDFQWSGELIATKVVPATTNESPSELLGALLRNVYGAFDFRDDSDVYDALATSVSGDLLRDLYLRVKRSLLMAEQGGALSHVEQVEVLAATPAIEATWRVTGTVEHWGHVHTRVNEYRGRVTVVNEGGTWKLKALHLLDEKRIRFETSIRGYDRD
ncbi:MAG: hypothetical protein ABI614_07280 [Planctomycetota bacterium]